MANVEPKPIPTEPRRFSWLLWGFILVLVVAPWCCIQWALAGERDLFWTSARLLIRVRLHAWRTGRVQNLEGFAKSGNDFRESLRTDVCYCSLPDSLSK
jgi:hypothetical protein